MSANQNLINIILSSDWLTVFLTQLKYSRFLVKLEKPNHARLDGGCEWVGGAWVMAEMAEALILSLY